MDEQIFRDYFIQLGRSFYASPIFKANPLVDPASEFGIGALASFMLAKRLVIESRRLPANPLDPPKPIHFEVPAASDFFVQRKSTRTTVGTRIRLFLKDEIRLNFETLVEIVRGVAPMLEFQIALHDEVTGAREIIPPRCGLSPLTDSLIDLKLPCDDELLRDTTGTLQICR